MDGHYGTFYRMKLFHFKHSFRRSCPRDGAVFTADFKKTLMDDGVHVSNLERKRRTKKKLAVFHQIFMSNTKRQFLLKSIVKLF